MCFILIVDVKVPILTHFLFSRPRLGASVLIREGIGDTVKTSKASCGFFNRVLY